MRIALTPLLALALVAPAVAQRGPGPHAPDRGFDSLEERLEMRGDRLAAALDLDAGQRQAFDRLRDERIARAQAIADQMRQTGDELRRRLEVESPDATAVGEQVIALHRLRQSLRDERESFDQALLEILTPEQQAVYNALETMRPERPGFDGRRGPGFGHGLRGPGGPPPVDGY